MYKLTRTNGMDFYSGTINYAENIGKIVRVIDYDGPEVGACGAGLHASKNPNDCFVGARVPCRAFKVKGIQKIAGDNQKGRYRALKVLEEVENLNTLFGWNYDEAVSPVNPFQLKPPKITDQCISLLKTWVSVRDSVGASVGAYIGSLFPKIKTWKYIEHTKGYYPFQSCVDLWRVGLVPSFNDKIWRLHGGPKGKILYELRRG